MAAYSVVRIRDVPNTGPRMGAGEDELEVRFLRDALALTECGVTLERFAAGWKPTFGHRHRRQEEVYVVVSGRALAKLDDEVIELEPWTAVRVAASTWRAFRAAGDEDLVLIAVGAPFTGPGDAENRADFWPA